MQAVQVSWVGKTFALARCSDYREKKPRSRRTKEERRTMVESFIKNYRSLNNGKFPSLNLTHKEVGGSFYTVREIVREIIQENRVLGPGNSTSKALNLEHCLEEHSDDPFSIHKPDNLSIATISHEIGQSEEQNHSLSNAYSSIVEEGYSLVESVTQETVVCHPKDISTTQVMHGKLEHANFSCGKLSENTDSHSEDNSSEQPGASKVERTFSSSQPVSMTSLLGDFVVNGDDIGNRKKNVARETTFTAPDGSVSEIVVADCLPEFNISTNSVSSSVSDEVQLHSYDREDLSLASTTDNTCNPESSHETEGLTSSLEVLETCKSANEVVTFMPFDEGSVINMTEPTEICSSTVTDEASAESVTNLAPAATTSELQPKLQPNDLGNMSTTNKSTSGGSLQPSAKWATYQEVQAEHEYIVNNTGSGSNSSSCSMSSDKANEEPETSEINPIWAAIQSLLTAVIKFWSE